MDRGKLRAFFKNQRQRIRDLQQTASELERQKLEEERDYYERKTRRLDPGW